MTQYGAIVTGAGSGIGKATAKLLAAEGIAVVAADIDKERARATVDEIAMSGGNARYRVVDVADRRGCAELSKEVGPVEILVACAGVQVGGGLADTSDPNWQRIVDVNLRGVANCCEAVLPGMSKAKSGSIVIVSSVNAVTGASGMAVYDATKAAVLGLMRSLAIDYGPRGIRVNAICPGNTITDYHIERLAKEGIDEARIRELTKDYGLLKRAAEPEEIANAIWFLASPKASFVTGETLVVDGGYSLSGR